MTVSELRKMLEPIDQDGEVYAWDADARAWCPVTGMVFDGEDNEVYLQTDDPS